jgi:maltoporin
MKTEKSTWMKKAACALSIALLLSTSVFAMELEGTIMLNAGTNFGALIPHFTNGADMDNSFHIGGRLQADYMLTQYASIGLESGFSTAEIGDTDYSIGTIPLLIRIAWHPFPFTKFDPYLVAKAGYGFAFFTNEGDDYDWNEECGGFMWGVNIGARYFFTPKVGFFLEAGYECLDVAWDHPNMNLKKWQESASAQSFGVIGLTIKAGK